MIFIPHKSQMEAIEWSLKHKTPGLLLPPGFGKTATTLMAFKLTKEAGYIDHMLIIAPLRVAKLVWKKEISKWDDFKHLKVQSLWGPTKDQDIRNKADIYTINPAGLEWLLNNSSKLPRGRWSLVCDESTVFKNHSSGVFKMLKEVLDAFDRRAILTGTPVPNGLMQLWSQTYILDQGQRLSKFITHYRSKYFYQPNPYNKWLYEILPGAEQQIYEAIDDIVVHKTLDELDLPPLVHNQIYVELEGRSRRIYDEMEEHGFVIVDDSNIVAPNAAAKAMKLKQISNGCVYDETKRAVHIHNEKIDSLKELVNELNGRPIMIVYEFLHDLDRLKIAFPAFRAMGEEDDEWLIYMWNANKIPGLILHPKSGGHGLNLQESNCRDIVWFSLTYDLELYQQTIARVHRQGVKHSIMVHHIIGENTIDEKVSNVLIRKDATQQQLLEAVKK